MSFEDYLAARRMHLTLNLFWNDARFEPMVQLANQMGANNWEWINKVNTIIAGGRGEVHQLFDQ